MTTIILLDTNTYVRLAKRVRPLLGFRFNPVKKYVLLVLPEVEKEVHDGARLRSLCPWFDDAELVSERGKNKPKFSRAEQGDIAKSKAFLLAHVARNVRSYMGQRRDPPGDADCQVMAVALEKKWCVATDDENMHILGGDFSINCLFGFDVLHKLLAAGMVSEAQVVDIYEALERNRDLPARWVVAKQKLFKKVFRKKSRNVDS